MANSYLNRTSIATPSSRRTFTMSAWVKKSDNSNSQGVIWIGSNTNNWVQFKFESGTDLRMECRNSGSNVIDLTTNRKFRDVNAWYHILAQVDTTQATQSNRVKLWVNGVQETSFATATYPSQNLDLDTTTEQKVGLQHGTQYFNGYISHAAYVDGSVVAPTTFGETDSTSGIWKFKTPTGVTWGTNGFHLKFENSGALGTDSSGNSNNFTVNGNLKQALDTPSNVYATLNALQRIDDYNFSNGNNTFTNTSAGAHRCVHSTLSASSGKWYAEVKVVEVGGTYPQIGVINPDVITFTDYLGGSNKGYGYLSDGRKQINGTATSYGNSYTAGDIIGIAMDLDNHKLYFHKNGTYQNSGVPTSGSTGTGAIDLATGVFYSFGQSSYKDSSNPVYSWNFGNGFFGTTAISSAGSNGNGSLFEYDVPTNYYALNTKNINTYG